MDTFINSASSPEWWISVVFVGIAINLASSGLGAVVQRQFGHLVKKWAERNEKLANERATRIKSLANSRHELYLANLELNRKRLDNIFDWVLAVALLGFGAAAKDTSSIAYTASTICAMLSAMQGLISMISYWKEVLLLLEAKFQSTARRRSSFSSNDGEPHN